MSNQGRFIWYELMTTDLNASRAFYAEVFDWRFSLSKNQTEPYFIANTIINTTTKTGDRTACGLMTLPEPLLAAATPPHWVGYVFVDDIDQSIEQAVQSGGRIMHPPMNIDNNSRFVTLADPQGATFCIFSSTAEPTEAEPVGIGHFGWKVLMTSDTGSAVGFYQALFGWTSSEEIQFEGEVYQTFHQTGSSGKGMGGITFVEGSQQPPNWFYGICTDNLEHCLERVRTHGGAVLDGANPLSGGARVAWCRDPQGAIFGLWKPSTP